MSLVCNRCSAVGVTVLGVTLYFEELNNLGLCRCVELQLPGLCRVGLQEQGILPDTVLRRGVIVHKLCLFPLPS